MRSKLFFPQVFTSTDLGICKPSPNFYQIIRERYFSHSTECMIVIDDDQRNVDAATENRWKGLCFNPDLDQNHTIEHLRKKMITELLR